MLRRATTPTTFFQLLGVWSSARVRTFQAGRARAGALHHIIMIRLSMHPSSPECVDDTDCCCTSPVQKPWRSLWWR